MTTWVFIVGYPKCGTSALYSYLKTHPGIFLPELKEPHYFTEDYPGVREVVNEEEYLRLFRDAGADQLKGDASASVIHSEVALDCILERYPRAKFILLVREPVAAVRSFHMELLHNFNEDVVDFERVWALQGARAEGREHPDTCKEPGFLQYKNIFEYRRQLPAFYEKVPAVQRLVLVFEEFFSAPRAGYLQVLNFLGLEDDGRDKFVAVNMARKHRFVWLAKVHRKLVDSNNPIYLDAKAALSRLGIHPSAILTRFNRKAAGKPMVSEAFEAELREYFRQDVDTVERLLGREIESWRR